MTPINPLLRTLLGIACLVLVVLAYPSADNNIELDIADCCDTTNLPGEGTICRSFLKEDGTCEPAPTWNVQHSAEFFAAHENHELDEEAADCCAGQEPPYDDAICIPSMATGSCIPVWVNGKIMFKRGSNSNPDAELVKRLEFVHTRQKQRLCEWDSIECLERDRSARRGDCDALALTWEQEDHEGFWIINPRDLAGYKWLRLMESGTCVLAVAAGDNTNLQGRSLLGNLDISVMLRQSGKQCGAGSLRVDAQGAMECTDFGLDFLVTGADTFECCT